MPVFKYKQSDKEKAASKRGKLSRRKGVEFERDIVRLFKDGLPDRFQVQRMLQGRGGTGLPDVEVRLEGDPLLHLECKHGKNPNIKKAIEQAVHDAHRGAIPATVTRADKGRILVTMVAYDFIQLLGGAYEKQQTEEG